MEAKINIFNRKNIAGTALPIKYSSNGRGDEHKPSD